LGLRAAIDGLGIAYTAEAFAEPFLRSGQLVRVLEDWSPTIEGLFLYYPGAGRFRRLFVHSSTDPRGRTAPVRSLLKNPFVTG